MSLSTQEIARLRRIIVIAQKIISRTSKQENQDRVVGRKHSVNTRIRRTGKELIQFRKMLKAQRKNGVPVAKLARKHGISSAYIYMIK